MKTARMLGNCKVEIIDVPEPTPAENEVLVKVTASALCGSEMGALRSENPLETNVGHEVSGIIADPNGHPEWKAGDRVGVFTLQGCGDCRWCREGKDTYCADVATVEATHSEYVTSRANALVKLPDDVSNALAVLLCGDGLGVPYSATIRAGVQPGQVTCVTGCGPIGLGHVLLQAHLGAKPIAIEPTEARREFAKELGAWQVIDPTATDDLVGLLRSFCDGLGPDAWFECSGRQEALDWALDGVKPGGTIAQIGGGALNLNPSGLMTRNLTLFSTWVCHPGWYPDMLATCRNGLDIERLVTMKTSFENAQEAYSRFEQGLEGKVILNWD